MKFATAALSAAALGLALASGAHADTRNSKDKATMEQKASPSGPKLDEERAESSQGQPNGADKEEAFKRLDIDGDGAISKAEAAGNAKLMNAFDHADKDRDGKLSRAEYDSMGSAPEGKAKAKSKVKAQAK